jgi:hypothetical protein
MGLDGVELVVEIEDSFEVVISDQEALRLITPGDILELLLQNKFWKLPQRPLMQPLFHDLRRAVVVEFGVPPRKIRPRAAIVETLPQFSTRARRERVLQALALPRPPQGFSGRLGLRRDFGSFGDLATELLARNYGELSRRLGTWHAREAWTCLRHIISIQTGVRLEKITRTVELVNDLGLD